MGDRAGEDDGGPLPRGLGSIGSRIVLGARLFERVHPGDADIPAEQKGLDPVLGLPSSKRPESRPEPDEELLHLDPERLGREEVARLVDHDDEEHDENEQSDADPFRHQANTPAEAT